MRVCMKMDGVVQNARQAELSRQSRHPELVHTCEPGAGAEGGDEGDGPGQEGTVGRDEEGMRCDSEVKCMLLSAARC